MKCGWLRIHKTNNTVTFITFYIYIHVIDKDGVSELLTILGIIIKNDA